MLILSALFLFWVCSSSGRRRCVHVPWYLWLVAMVILAFFPIRWILRRPWTLVAETSGGYDLPAEHWTGMIRGRQPRRRRRCACSSAACAPARTPGHADSPLHPVN